MREEVVSTEAGGAPTFNPIGMVRLLAGDRMFAGYMACMFLLGLGIYIWLDGRATDKAGQVWFEMSQFTLNYSQVIIQRHLGLDKFWFDSVLPYLQRPAWEAIHTGNRSDPLLRGGMLKGGGGYQAFSFVDIIAMRVATKGRRGGQAWPGYDSEPVYKAIKIEVGGGLGAPGARLIGVHG